MRNELVNFKQADEPLRELALFAGAGGGILGGKLLGWNTVCAVEWEPYPACVLARRQDDGLLPPFPIWDDVQTFDGKPWRGLVDVVSGGFPCQDISSAGRGAGIEGERSGMWREFARIIREIRPRFVFVENSPMLTSRGLGRVLGDLASMGFDARWCVLGAADVGANHQRDRIWVVGKQVGNSNNDGQATTKVREGFAQGGNSHKKRQIEASESERSSLQYTEVAYAPSKGLQGVKREEHEGIGVRSTNSSKEVAYPASQRQQRQGQSFQWGSSTEERERQANNVESIGQRNQWEAEPNVVEWLMGWPLEWTDLKPLETDKCHSVRQQHGEFSRQICSGTDKIKPTNQGA